MSDTQDLVDWMRAYARALRARDEPTHGNDAGLELAANRLEALEDALKSVEAWLTSWGSHVAYCRGYPNCTCGLDAMRNEARVALSDPRALEEQKP